MGAKVILVVESDLDTRNGLFDLLGSEGHLVFEAGNADDAKKILAATPIVNFVLANLGVSDCAASGEIVDQIRLIRPDVPILLISASQSLYATAEKHRVSAIKKPFRVEQLLEAIDDEDLNSRNLP
ncbi:MAG: response regulator [Proteobacteria bacterium]|nr:MAG: response regulator [Pseudomonadota bacterium]